MVFFPVLYVTILFLPGALLLRGLRIKTVPVFVAALLSLTIMSFALAAVRGAGGRPSTYTVLVFAFLVAAALFVTYRLATRYRRENHPAWRWRVLGRRYGVSVVVALVAALYAAWSGPYLEIPSDSLWHLSLLQDQLQAIEADRGRALHSIGNIFDKQQEYWYWIYAWAAHVSGTSIDGTLHSAWIIHAVVIVLSVYQFALYLFRKRRLDRFLLQAVGAASALFFVLHFGISVFNYVRYYAFAPTILGYTGYLGAVYAFLVYLEKPRGGYKHLAVSILLLVGTFMLHKQETMFAVVMIGLVLALRWFRGFGYGHRWQSSSTSSHVTVVGAGSRTTIWFALFVAVYLSTHAYLYFNGMRNDPLTGGFMFSLENMLPFLKNLYVLIPTFQFYQVITVWGVLVYVLYVVRRSEFRGIDFVHAGMLSPLITVFNPVFTDLFLRLSYPEVLWRLCYLIPLYFVAGYLFVFSVKGLTSAPVRGTFVHGLSVALIVLLLFPINTTFFESP